MDIVQKIEPPVILETARLRLRQWQANDRTPFAKLNADTRVMQFFPSTLSRPQSDLLVDRFADHIDEQGWGLWATEIIDNHEFIGFVGLNIPSSDLPVYPCIEIGWRLAFDYWHRGFATEAGLAVIRFGFNILHLEEIIAFTAVGNYRSRAVMQRLGMQERGTFEHPRIPLGNPLRTHCAYRLSAQ